MLQPSVHFLEFNDSISPTNDPDRFHVLWHLSLADLNNPPQRKASGAASEPESKTEEWKGIFEGDLVVFPSLLSGGGEFEVVRFVGPKTTHLPIMEEGETKEEEVLPLLTAGIEYPEFPTLIVSMAEQQGVPLRDLYEVPFNAILKNQPPNNITLLDIMGGDEAGYKEFWDDPPVARRRRPPSGNPWKFSLTDCVWIRTLDGKMLAGDASTKGDGEL